MAAAFIETPRFPEKISYGVTGGPTYKTEIVEVRGGSEQRNSTRLIGLGKYDASHGIKTPAEIAELVSFFRICRGRWAGFRFKDWSDYIATVSNGRLGTTAIGTGFPTYKLYKRYIAGAYYDDRRIAKPVSGTVKVFKDAVEQVSGWTIDTATGIVTFTALSSFNISAITKASPGVVTATGHTFSNGDLIYVSGVLGMAEVNDRVFTIGGVSGANFNLGIDTSAYTTYTSAGTAAKHIQPAVALTWSGEFDVPSRFDTDEMGVTVQSFGSNSWDSIIIRELRIEP